MLHLNAYEFWRHFNCMKNKNYIFKLKCLKCFNYILCGIDDDINDHVFVYRLNILSRKVLQNHIRKWPKPWLQPQIFVWVQSIPCVLITTPARNHSNQGT